MTKNSNRRKNNKSRKNREMKNKKLIVQYSSGGGGGSGKRPSMWFDGNEYHWDNKFGDYVRWFKTGGRAVAVSLTQAKQRATQAIQTATMAAPSVSTPPSDSLEPKTEEPASGDWENGDPIDVSKDEDLFKKYLGVSLERVDWGGLLKDDKKLAEAMEGKCILANPRHVDKEGAPCSDSSFSSEALQDIISSSAFHESLYKDYGYDRSKNLRIALDDGTFLDATYVDPNDIDVVADDLDLEIDSYISRAKGYAINLSREIKAVSEGESPEERDPFFLEYGEFGPSGYARDGEPLYDDDVSTFLDDLEQGVDIHLYNPEEYHIPNIADVFSKNVFLVSPEDIKTLKTAKPSSQSFYSSSTNKGESKSLVESYYTDDFENFLGDVLDEDEAPGGGAVGLVLHNVLPFAVDITVDEFAKVMEDSQVKDEYIEQFIKDAGSEEDFDAAREAIINLPYPILGRVCRNLANQNIAAAQKYMASNAFDKLLEKAKSQHEQDAFNDVKDLLENEDVSLSCRNELARNVLGFVGKSSIDAQRYEWLIRDTESAKKSAEDSYLFHASVRDENNHLEYTEDDYLFNTAQKILNQEYPHIASEVDKLPDSEKRRLSNLFTCAEKIYLHPKATVYEKNNALRSVNRHVILDKNYENGVMFVPEYRGFDNYPELAMTLDDIKQRR